MLPVQSRMQMCGAPLLIATHVKPDAQSPSFAHDAPCSPVPLLPLELLLLELLLLEPLEPLPLVPLEVLPPPLPPPPVESPLPLHPAANATTRTIANDVAPTDPFAFIFEPPDMEVAIARATTPSRTRRANALSERAIARANRRLDVPETARASAFASMSTPTRAPRRSGSVGRRT